MSWSPGNKAVWRGLAGTERITLAKIDLSVPSSRTLRYATHECPTPDGAFWQEGLECDSIREAIDVLAPGVTPVDASIRLVSRRDASQTSGTVLDLLSDFLFQNAAVTLYLWSPGMSAPEQVFKGTVSRPVRISPGGVTLHLLQDQTWNKQTPPTVVDKVSYPDSPDVSQGIPIPVVYGDHRAPGLRSPWAAAYTNKSKQEDSGAGSGVVPLVLVDAGVGGSKVKVVGASHALAELLDRANGYSSFIVGDNLLNPIETAGGAVTEVLGASESYLEIADESVIAYAAVIPIDVRTSENTATNPRRAMDPHDETTFATLDQNTAKNELQLVLPNPGGLGRIESVQYYVAWSGNAGNGNNLRIRTKTPGGAFGTTSANWVATATAAAIQTGTWSASDYSQNWDFGGSGTVFDVRIDFTGGTTNQARIYWVVLVVKYRPQRSLVTPGASLWPVPPILQPLGLSPRQAADMGPIGNILYGLAGLRPNTIAPTFRVESQFYANLKGYADDGSGTYTGVAAALIERAPDIMRHFLVTYGGVSGGNVETGASTPGSFVLVRSELRNAQPNDFKLACWIGVRTTVQRVLQQMAEQSACCVYLDRFTDKWLCFPWKPGAAVDYDRAISWDDLMGIEVEETSVVSVQHAIRVKYGFDHFKANHRWEAFTNAAGSGQGRTQPTVRDQLLKVTAGVNDALNWNFAATDRSATLTPGTYSGIDYAAEVRSKMRALSGNELDCGYSFHIKAGYNDVIAFELASTAQFNGTLSPGSYDAEGLARECARAMNAAIAGVPGVSFTCTYDHATNKFTWACAGTTFRLWGLSDVAAPSTITSANRVMGNLNVSPGGGVYAASVTAAHTRYSDRFWLCVNEAGICNWKWASGAGAATNCADTMGYVRTDSGFVNTDLADYSRGSRETIATTYEGYYGPREERQISADWIRDENSAVDLRNRLFDLTAQPRVRVRFSSMRFPDLRRMQVIEFSSDLDAIVPYPKYGSDGSWAGKAFRVLEVEQHLGPSYHTEVLAVEA